MPVYDRTPADELQPIDRWEDGFGWLAHPHEEGQRVSHAVRTRDGEVWVIDPIDAPGLDDRLDEFGSVAGVAVLADYHARDAGRIADRHDVPVTVPEGLGNRLDRVVTGGVERTAGPIAGFELRVVHPLYAWHEAIAYRPWDRTLYVPDYLSSKPAFCLPEERLGLPTVARLRPPRRLFADLEPERIVLGHGAGVFDEASAALDGMLANARRGFPRALVSNVPAEVRSVLGALRG